MEEGAPEGRSTPGSQKSWWGPGNSQGELSHKPGAQAQPPDGGERPPFQLTQVGHRAPDKNNKYFLLTINEVPGFISLILTTLLLSFYRGGGWTQAPSASSATLPSKRHSRTFSGPRNLGLSEAFHWGVINYFQSFPVPSLVSLLDLASFKAWLYFVLFSMEALTPVHLNQVFCACVPWGRPCVAGKAMSSLGPQRLTHQQLCCGSSSPRTLGAAWWPAGQFGEGRPVRAHHKLLGTHFRSCFIH